MLLITYESQQINLSTSIVIDNFGMYFEVISVSQSVEVYCGSRASPFNQRTDTEAQQQLNNDNHKLRVVTVIIIIIVYVVSPMSPLRYDAKCFRRT